MITVPRTGTRYPTEFRVEISHRVGGFLAATPVRDKSAREEFPTGHERADAGGTGRRFRRQLPAQQQCGSAAANPMNEAFAGRTRRASFIRPPPVTSRPSLDLAAMTRGDPPRIGRVKRNVRTPPDPGQPTGAPQTETAVTPKARFMPKRPGRASLGDTTRGAGHRRSRHHGPRPSRNSPSSNQGSGAYAHTMPARGVFLVRRREVDLLRIASAACCLGAGHSPLVSAGPSGRRAAGGRSRCGNGNSGRINRIPSTR